MLILFMLQPHARADTSTSAVLCEQPWQAWQSFRNNLISAEGRVIDNSDPRQITTSEGQSYALFLALVNDDREMFQRLLDWTEKNLAQGDLTRHLPAWLWGRQDNNDWGVLDDNPAADSDLWIAYSLLEAGRLWGVRQYTLYGHLLLQRIAREEMVTLPDHGAVLLPGKSGFVDDDGWRLNPSYVPPQLVARAATALPDSPWSELNDNAVPFLIDSAPLGIAPDWVVWDGQRWTYPGHQEQWASYNAIRVYLWTGMLSDDASQARELKAHFRQVQDFIDQNGLPAESLNVLGGEARGEGPAGFSAALLPLFGQDTFGESQRRRVEAIEFVSLGYYSQVLVLFGQGWDEHRFRFDDRGRVAPFWEGCP